MMRKAVIDRFEEEFAVLLFDQGDEKLVISRSQLPPEAQEGHWLQVTFAGEPGEAGEEEEAAGSEETVETEVGSSLRAADILTIRLDEEETDQVSRRIAGKLNQLRRGDHRSD
jgi:hypothetical protein